MPETFAYERGSVAMSLNLQRRVIHGCDPTTAGADGAADGPDGLRTPTTARSGGGEPAGLGAADLSTSATVSLRRWPEALKGVARREPDWNPIRTVSPASVFRK